MSMLTPSPSCILATGVDGYYSAIPPWALIAIGICIGVIGTLCIQKILSPRESKWVINNFKVDGAQTTTYSEINFMGPGSVRASKRSSRNSIEIGEVYYTHESDLKKFSANRIPYEESPNSGKRMISSRMSKLHPRRPFYVSPRMKKMGSGLSEEDEKCRLSALRSSSNLCNLRISSTGPGSGFSGSSLPCGGDYRQPEGSSYSMLQFLKNDNRPSTIANRGSNETNLSADIRGLHMEGSSCKSREDSPPQNIQVVGEDKTQVLSLTNLESSEKKQPGAKALGAKTLSDWAIARDTTTSVTVGADEGALVSPGSRPLQGEISVAFPERINRLASSASTQLNPSHENIIPIIEAPSLDESSAIEPFGVEVESSSTSSDEEKESKNSIFILDKHSFRRSTQLLSNDSYLTVASTNSNLLLATPGPPNPNRDSSRLSSPDRGSNRLSSFRTSNSKPLVFRQFKPNLSVERNKPVSISPFQSFSEGAPQSISFDPGAYSFTSELPLVEPFLGSEKTSNRVRLEV